MQVYDVTKFQSTHPGGAHQLISGAGRDITQVFRCYHKDSSEKYGPALNIFYFTASTHAPLVAGLLMLWQGDGEVLHWRAEQHAVPKLPAREVVICVNGSTTHRGSEFARTVKARVYKYFADKKQDPKHAPSMIARYVAVNALLLITQWGMVR